MKGEINVKISDLISSAIAYDAGDARRIQHFMKVYAFAKAIAEGENADSTTMEIIEAAAVLHDIGIHECERKYGSCSGKYQEKEGVPVAEKILAELGADSGLTERVCFLIAHHHTFTGIDSLDWQILVEADFLVNIYEEGLRREAVESIRRKVFKTSSGLGLLDNMYLK